MMILKVWEEWIFPQSGIVLFENGIEWEASLSDVGLSKSLRTKAQCHFQRGQYIIGEKFIPPTKRYLLGFKGKPPPSPFVGSCVTGRSASAYCGSALLRVTHEPTKGEGVE